MPIRWARVLAVAVVLAAGAASLGRPFAGAESFERDWCQHLWWTQRFADPDLFPGDPSAEFLSRPLFSPHGVQAWYRLTAPWLGVEPAAKTLSVLLVLASLALAARAGRSLTPSRPLLGAVVCAALLGAQRLGLPAAVWGLPRSFSLPLHLLGFVALLEGRTRLLGVTLVLCALLYPPAVIVVGGAAGLVYLARLLRTRRLPPKWPGLALLTVAAAVLVVVNYRQGGASEAGFGPKVTRAQAERMEEFGPEGRSRYFVDDPARFWVRSARSGLSMDPPEAAVTFAVALAVLLLRRRLWPAPIWALLGASMLAFAAAHATLYALHLPNRYVSVALPLVRALGGTVLVVAGLEALLRRFPTLATPPHPARLAVGATGVAVIVFATLSANDLSRRHADTPPDLAAARAFVASLPKDAVVAAHPSDADTLPLRTGRSTLASWETALPYWLGYYATQRERLTAALDALYAADWATVDGLARYGVRAYLVHARHFAPDRGVEAPAPFRVPALARRDAGRASPSGFVLQDPPPDRILFRSGAYTVVRVGAPTDR